MTAEEDASSGVVEVKVTEVPTVEETWSVKGVFGDYGVLTT